jgi:hypothetical protein
MASSQSTQKLQVSDEGLRAEGGSCESLASKLASNRAPTGMGPLELASAAATNAARAQVTAANIRCTFRVQATAAKLSAVANGYTETEVSSAAQLEALKTPTVL